MNNIKKKLHVLLVEDHDLISLGVQVKLEKEYQKSLVFTLKTNADEALDYLQKNTVDILLLDLVLKSEYPMQLKSGDELLRKLHGWENKPKVIILSKIDSLDMLNYCIEYLEADGYIFKSKSSLNEIVIAIDTVLIGENYYSNQIKKILKYQFGLLDIDTSDRVILKELSNGGRQKGIMKILSEKDIQMSVSAIEKRIRKLKIRFDALTTAHLVSIAIRKGIIE